MGLKQDFIAGIGEFTGTTLFLLLALGGAKTAQFTLTSAQTDGLQVALNSQTIIFIAVSFGLSLLVTAWVFYRVTGGLFNPAITLALYLIGGLTAHRAVILTVAQILGGIAGSALVAALTPFGGVESVVTKLDPRVNLAQGLFLEAFLTAILVLTVLLLAAEKHRATHLAPIGIGLVLLACHMFGVVWTGCGINPARAFGPSVISGSFETYHWIYWLGPLIGALMAVGFYLMLKAFDYTSVVFDQDADHEDEANKRHVVGSTLFRRAKGKGKMIVYHAKAGHKTGDPVQFKEYDEKDETMQEAIRNGQASIIETHGPANDDTTGDMMDAAENGQANGHVSGLNTPRRPMASSRQSSAGPSWHASAQGLGAMQSPGSSSTGLANIPGVGKLLSS